MKKNRLMVASSEDNADMLYACGFKAPDPFIYFSKDKDKGIIVSSLEYGRALSEVSKGVDVYNLNDFTDKSKTGGISTEEVLLVLSKRLAVPVWEVPGTFPVKYADCLRNAGIKVEWKEKSFFPRRARKSRSEIKMLEEAMAVTEKAMDRAFCVLSEASIGDDKRLLWNGELLTSEILRAEIDIEILRGGGIPNSTIAACGVQSAEPHNVGSGPIFAGQTIVIDIFPRMKDSGYWGDMTRTFLKGKAPIKIKRAYDAVREARDECKKIIRTGIIASEVHQVAVNILSKRGFKTGKYKGKYRGFIHGLGHGVGLDIHEAPRLSPANPKVLETGNVVTVEPGLYYPEWGGIRLEDMVAVTKDSCDCLTSFDTVLEIP